MRFMTFATFYAVLAVGAAVGAAGSAAAMSPASGTIELRATATFSDGTSADRLYRVRSDADSDGDGLGDESWLRVRCDNSISTAVFEYSVKSPRDAASGLATGKRMHKPMTIMKEWGAREAGAVIGSKVSWDLATNKGGKAGSPKIATYDVKKLEGGRAKTMSHDSWHEVTLADGAPNLCS